MFRRRLCVALQPSRYVALSRACPWQGLESLRTLGGAAVTGRCWRVPVAGAASSASSALADQRRGLKTLDVREYRPLGTPIEFRFYQRYANHPNRQSGVQFLTHYNTHQRFRVKKDYIDYMFWGKEQGQARLPHRHQRVAFDFGDDLHKTAAPHFRESFFAGQDPTAGAHPDLAASFDANRKVFSHPEHWNKMFSKRRPGEGTIKLGPLESRSLLLPLSRYSDTPLPEEFHLSNSGHSNGIVPGVNVPFRGEMDRKMMQAMSVPLVRDNTITGNDGRFSKTVYMNNPESDQVLPATMAEALNVQLDRATNALHSKLTVLEAAQSGKTDFFCGGLDFDAIGFDLTMNHSLRTQAELALQRTEDLMAGSSEAERLLSDAMRYEDRVDNCLRQHAALLWRVFTAPRPLMTLTNGRCRGTGCGLSLLSKYNAVKDSTEYIFDGPNMGITPFGGMTRLLARPETSLKYPGLAEFIVLTGTSLFAGDVLRLGWTDLFTSVPDIGYHIKEWFNSTEHMHNDAVAWQLGQLLDNCFRLKEVHTSAMERSAINATRARWIEDAFADQPSVLSIQKTLSEIEQLPYGSAHNTQDPCMATPFSLVSVDEGIALLKQSHLSYSLAPWDVTPLGGSSGNGPVQQLSEVFTSYVLERRGPYNIVVNKDSGRLAAWKSQREAEYHAYKALQSIPCPRHVHARLEGCEGKLIEFDFDFMRDRHIANLVNPSSDDAVSTAVLDALKARILQELGMPATRDVEVGWYLPTLDTAPIFSDEELQAVLHTDPGIENAKSPSKYPPLYLIVKRNSLYFSEWAYAVKHQLLLQSPFALSAAFEMLQEIRGDGSAEAVQSTAEALATEFKYVSQLLRRPDFYLVGQHTLRSSDRWEEIKEERARNIHKSEQPLRPLPDFEAVFERDVEIDGHKFLLRPRWSPRTLEEVSTTLVAQLRAPLDYEKDGIVPLCVATQCAKADRIDGMVDDVGGAEVVCGLGERDSKVKPLVSNASVPKNVNFYEMARHPWDDTATSWRQDGYTAGSMEYFTAQYKEAERALYDSDGRGVHSYWPSKAASEGISSEQESQALLNERLYDVIHDAEKRVEPWARSLRQQALKGKVDYKVEVATQQEKIYDDEYYRWFIQPGVNPNPSGLLIGKSNAGGREGDSELDQMLREIVTHDAATIKERVSTSGGHDGDDDLVGFDSAYGIGQPDDDIGADGVEGDDVVE